MIQEIKNKTETNEIRLFFNFYHFLSLLCLCVYVYVCVFVCVRVHVCVWGGFMGMWLPGYAAHLCVTYLMSLWSSGKPFWKEKSDAYGTDFLVLL